MVDRETSPNNGWNQIGKRLNYPMVSTEKRTLILLVYFILSIGINYKAFNIFEWNANFEMLIVGKFNSLTFYGNVSSEKGSTSRILFN